MLPKLYKRPQIGEYVEGYTVTEFRSKRVFGIKGRHIYRKNLLDMARWPGDRPGVHFADLAKAKAQRSTGTL